MAIAISELIAGIFKPAAELVDSLHTSEEERLQAQTVMMQVQLNGALALLDYESKLNEMKGAVVLAEAQGGSMIQRIWRPVTMLTFLSLVVLDSFDLLAFRLADQAWTLLQIGLGGYVVGRSAEKVVPKLRGAQ